MHKLLPGKLCEKVRRDDRQAINTHGRVGIVDRCPSFRGPLESPQNPTQTKPKNLETLPRNLNENSRALAGPEIAPPTAKLIGKGGGASPPTFYRFCDQLLICPWSGTAQRFDGRWGLAKPKTKSIPGPPASVKSICQWSRRRGECGGGLRKPGTVGFYD
jgi:hypothetical protein